MLVWGGRDAASHFADGASYDLTAKGGQWGMSETRSIHVELTDIAFGLAGDSEQDLSSKPSPYAALTANLR